MAQDKKDYREIYDNLYLLIQDNYHDSWWNGDEGEDLAYEHIPEEFQEKSGWGCLEKDLKPLTKQDCLDLIEWADTERNSRYVFEWYKEDKKKYDAIKSSLFKENTRSR